jgi:hypothetical protein
MEVPAACRAVVVLPDYVQNFTDLGRKCLGFRIKAMMLQGKGIVRSRAILVDLNQIWNLVTLSLDAFFPR